jgi:hypothetical protein
MSKPKVESTECSYPTLLPEIVDAEVDFPRMTVWWSDGSRTTVELQLGEAFNFEKGVMAAMAKKAYGNKGYNNQIRKVNKLAEKRFNKLSEEEKHKQLCLRLVYDVACAKKLLEAS